MANKKFFGKMLDLIGLEETTLDEEYFDRDYEDGNDFEPYDPEPGYPYQDDYDREEYDEPVRKSAFGRGGAARKAREKEVVRERESFSAPKERERERDTGKVVGMASNNKMKMIVYQPMTYDDTQNIIDNLKNRKPVIVNLESLDLDVAQRILDFMSGAAYALNGNIHKVSKGIFILGPTNVDITGNIPDDLQGKSFYTLGSKARREL